MMEFEVHMNIRKSMHNSNHSVILTNLHGTPNGSTNRVPKLEAKIKHMSQLPNKHFTVTTTDEHSFHIQIN